MPVMDLNSFGLLIAFSQVNMVLYETGGSY